MFRRVSATLLLVCAAMFCATGGCEALLGVRPAGGTGTLRVLVTDKPYPYDFIQEALVTITRVEVRLASSQPASQPSSQSSSQPSTQPDDEGFVTIFTGSKSFNLLDLRNGKTDLLAGADIPAGTYDQMRLIVTDGKVTLTDGRVFNL